MAMNSDILEEIKKLKEFKIIVEGKKDKEALLKLDVKDVICLNNRPLHSIAESLKCNECNEVVILTDLDKEGKRIYSALKAEFQRKGIKVNDRFRNYLYRETKLRQIEGISGYVERFKNLDTLNLA